MGIRSFVPRRTLSDTITGQQVEDLGCEGSIISGGDGRKHLESFDLLYAHMGWLARMESQHRSERTKAGLARVVAQEKKLGRVLRSKAMSKRKKKDIYYR